jgi:hypothetical protein
MICTDYGPIHGEIIFRPASLNGSFFSFKKKIEDWMVALYYFENQILIGHGQNGNSLALAPSDWFLNSLAASNPFKLSHVLPMLFERERFGGVDW